MTTPNKTEKAGLLYHVLDHLKLLSCRYNVKTVVERIRTDDSPHLPPPLLPGTEAYNQQLPGKGACVGVKTLTSTIFSMCFLMIVGSVLGFTDTAHSSIMVGLGSGAGAGLEFCCKCVRNQRASVTLGGREVEAVGLGCKESCCPETRQRGEQI